MSLRSDGQFCSKNVFRGCPVSISEIVLRTFFRPSPKLHIICFLDKCARPVCSKNFFPGHQKVNLRVSSFANTTRWTGTRPGSHHSDRAGPQYQTNKTHQELMCALALVWRYSQRVVALGPFAVQWPKAASEMRDSQASAGSSGHILHSVGLGCLEGQ